MKKLFFLAFPLLLVFFLWAKAPAVTVRQSFADTPRMKQYWLVWLLKGKNRSQDSVTAASIQEGHLANIRRLGAEGVLIMAGPMGYDRDLRGIFILDAKDSATAASYINTDPAIKAGRLRFELHPWWTQTGTYQFR